MLVCVCLSVCLSVFVLACDLMHESRHPEVLSCDGVCSLALGMGERKFSNPNAVLKSTGFGAVKDVQEGSGAAVYKTTSQVTCDAVTCDV